MNAFIERLEKLNRYELLIPDIALAIFVYYHVAYVFFTYTNAAAQRILPDAFEFTQMVFRPEPYETPVYFLGFLIIPLLAVVFAGLGNWLVDQKYIRAEFVQKWPVALVIGGLLFLSYKVALHLFWFDQWREIEPRGNLKLQGLLGLSLAIGLLFYWLQFDMARFFAWVERWPWQKIRPILFLVLILLLFSPNFPFDYHHYSDQIGPAHDLLAGKQFLNRDTGTYSHYGLLNTYLWWGVFSFVPFSFQTASVVIFLSLVLWYFVWYLILKQWLRSEVLAVIGVFAMIISLTFPNFNMDFIYGGPSSTPFHQLGFLLVAGFWLKFALNDSHRSLNWILFTTAVSMFWYVDTGVYSVLATIATLTFWYLFRPISLSQKVKSFSWVAVKLMLMIVALGGVYSAWQFWRLGAWPDWPLLYFAASIYNSGYTMIPLPSHGIYYIYIFVFLVSLGYIVWKAVRDSNKLQELTFPLFLTLFGILQMVYYITRSHTTNLAPRLSVFLIALLAWWFVLLKDKRESKPPLYFAFSGVAAALVIFTVASGSYKIWTTLKTRDYSTIAENYHAEFVGRPDVYGGNADILGDIAILRRDYASLEKPAVFHWWDTKIMIDLNKTNYFPIFLFQSLLLKSEVDPLIAKTRQERPQYVFVGRKDVPGIFGFEMFIDKLDYFYQGIKDLYEVDRELKTMNVLTLRSTN